MKTSRTALESGKNNYIRKFKATGSILNELMTALLRPLIFLFLI